VVKRTVSAGKDVMIMSTGGLLENPGILRTAEKKGSKVYLPSGAVCGLDGIKAARIGKIRSLTLTTRKPARGLLGAPYIVKKGIDLKRIKKETTIFSGSATEAVKAFPKNINVSATLSLAGLGAKKTRVRIITSPKYRSNTHEVELIGSSGRIYTRCENVPSSENPKTSMLAAFSAIATLKGIVESVKIGT
jgi:aspartate dehydrogenase